MEQGKSQSSGLRVLPARPCARRRARAYEHYIRDPRATEQSPDRRLDGGARRSRAQTSILVVDDDVAICELLADFLESLGFRVLRAQTGTDALAMIRDTRPDLVITDMSMPEMGGVELCETLERRPDTASIPRLIMSAWPTRVARDLAGGHAHAFLRKPFDLDNLESMVFGLLAEHGL